MRLTNVWHMVISVNLISANVATVSHVCRASPNCQYPLRELSGHKMQGTSVIFNDDWEALGPFLTGTREAVWGADPAEQLGGVHLSKDEDLESLRSSLTPNATVNWTKLDVARESKSADDDDIEVAELHARIVFPDVNWQPNQTPYGWPASQYQAWMRGSFEVSESSYTQRFSLQLDGALDIIVNGERHFGGDFYTFRRSLLDVTLKTGTNLFYARYIKDARAFGGTTHSIDTTIRITSTRNKSSPLEIVKGSVLISDLVDGRLPSELGSVAVHNTGSVPLRINSVRSKEDSGSTGGHASLAHDGDLIIQPGQTRPVSFTLTNWTSKNLNLMLIYSLMDSGHHSEERLLTLEHTLQVVSLGQILKVTHRHPSGVISYAMIQPPSRESSNGYAKAPILLFLHGAGVDVSDYRGQDNHEYLPDLAAYLVIPSGVTPWCGDDWHYWGFADAQAAVHGLQHWAEAAYSTTGKSALAVQPDTNAWIVAGHSNGGQGAWHVLTHYPDRVFAGIPVSGYTSIQNYVPYIYWHSMDSRRRAVLEAATNSFRHEILAGNCAGIEIEQQHGDLDDNVPPLHSKMMNSLVHESTGFAPNFAELTGNQSGHWFDGIMKTPNLTKFYRKKLLEYHHGIIEHPFRRNSRGIEFSLTVANPADTSSKGAIEVLHLSDPGQIGRLKVQLDKKQQTWDIRTSNILSFRLLDDNTARSPYIPECGRQVLKVDGQSFKVGQLLTENAVYLSKAKGVWYIREEISMLPPRRKEHMGGINAIMRTKGDFDIVYQSEEASKVALQISRNLYQYYFAGASIRNGKLTNMATPRTVSRITLAIGSHLPTDEAPNDFPIRPTQLASQDFGLEMMHPLDESSVKLRSASTGGGIGAIYLRPLTVTASNETQLELVVWGSNSDMLWWASRLVPTITGVSQPDFIVFTERMKWQGAGSTLMGFFDSSWKITSSSAVDIDPEIFEVL